MGKLIVLIMSLGVIGVPIAVIGYLAIAYIFKDEIKIAASKAKEKWDESNRQ